MTLLTTANDAALSEPPSRLHAAGLGGACAAAPVNHDGAQASARCGAMCVSYYRQMPESERERASDRIDILIPGDQCALQAVHRASDGRLRRTVIRGPQLAVFAAGQSYSLRGDGRSDLILMELEEDFLESRARETTSGQAPPPIEHFVTVDPFLREIGNVLRSLLRTPGGPGAEYLQSLAGVIAVHLAPTYHRAQAPLPAYAGLPPHKINRVKAFISEHLGEPLSVPRLAATIHMSAYHFARMFKKATGQPPHLYITMLRVERAMELLRDGDLAVVDAAATVGFQTQSHFTEVFRRYAGMTPRRYRVDSRLRDLRNRPTR